MITYRDGWFELALLDNVGRFPRHTHDEFVISANLNGVERVWLDGKTFDVDTRQVTTYNPQQLQGSDNTAARWQCASLYVQPAAFQHFFDQPFLFSQGCYLAPSVAQTLILLARQPMSADSASVRQEQILVLLATLMQTASTAPVSLAATRDGGRVKRLKARLLSDLALPPSLDVLAREEQVSVSHLVRSFHRDAGLPPLAWLMQRRMHAARALLRQGMNISQVAVSLGFADQAHFTKAFNRFNAMTPGRFQHINL